MTVAWSYFSFVAILYKKNGDLRELLNYYTWAAMWPEFSKGPLSSWVLLITFIAPKVPKHNFINFLITFIVPKVPKHNFIHFPPSGLVCRTQGFVARL